MQTVCIIEQKLSQTLPVDGFKWKQNATIEWRIYKKPYEDSDKGYILEVDVEYPKRLHILHCDLPFLLERMKINNCNKLDCNLRDKKSML